MTATRLHIGLIAGLVGISSAAHAENLVPVETLYNHPPLFIDLDSIRREGSTVSLTYVLEATNQANIIDATIDCAAKTAVTTGLRIRPETLPPGAVRTLHPEPPQPFKETSTWGFLAKMVCK